MKVLTSTIPATAAPSQTAALLCACFHTAHAAGDFIFFDIETTGLSAGNSMCWLIGTLVLQDDSLILTQYFADSPSDEKELMEQFLGTLSATSCLVHFNGTRFDIPFLQERAALLECDAQLAAKLTDCDSIDIFKMIKSYDSLLHLTNYKQKTIESFLNFPRTDKLDGKKLIALYKSYVLSKDTDSERLLLLHNSDDLAGLHEICAGLAYGQLYDTALKKDSVDSFKKVFENISMEFNYASDYEGNEITELILETTPVFPFPKALDCKQPDGYCKIFPDKLRLCVPVVNDRVKLFYKDYKNYYYLPEQNCAIHKSVAAYVDKSRRTAATKNTCYTWVEPHTLNTPAALHHFLTAYLWHLLQ